MKASELREMSDEQLRLTLKETADNFFRLRTQAQTERLDAPSELRKSRRLIARINTVRRERELAVDATSAVKNATAVTSETVAVICPSRARRMRLWPIRCSFC